MDTLVKADIFFFITAVVTVLLGVLVAVALVYVIRILRDVKDVSNVVKKESELISEDIADLRTNVRQEGAKLKNFADFFSKIYKRNKKRK